MILYKSFAKINLFLHVLGKTENNYHLLESIFHLVNLYDTLSFSIANETKVMVTGSYPLNHDNNIVTKILAYIKDTYSVKTELDIVINKKIPLGSGMGGASSNAAVTIMALNKIFNLNLSPEQMQNIGLKFGADIPFFLHETSMAFIEGVGDIITPLEKGLNYPIILIYPNKEILTGEVFKQITTNTFSTSVKDNFISASVDLVSFIKKQNNDLFLYAQNIFNELDNIINFTKTTAPLLTRMSGSGSTIFAIYNNDDDCNLAFNIIKEKFPLYQIIKSKLI